jgi:hypothetical protein
VTKQQAIPVWTWRDAVRVTPVPPLTKLVCHALAHYLSDAGKGCFPAVETLMADTGLSNRSIATHLQNAADAGLLVIDRRTGRDGRFRGTVYLPRFPDTVTLARAPAVHVPDDDDMRETHTGPDASEPDRVNVAHVDRPREGGSPGPREPDDMNRVNLLHAEVSIEKLPLPPSPRRGNGSAGEGEVRSALLEGLRADGRAQHVVDQLIAPLLAKLRTRHFPDALGTLLGIRDRLRHHSQGELQAACEALGDVWARDFPNQPACVAAVKAAQAKQASGVQYTAVRGTPQHAAWLAFFQATKPYGVDAQHMPKSGSWSVPAEYPPAQTAASRPAAAQAQGATP